MVRHIACLDSRRIVLAVDVHTAFLYIYPSVPSTHQLQLHSQYHNGPRTMSAMWPWVCRLRQDVQALRPVQEEGVGWRRLSRIAQVAQIARSTQMIFIDYLLHRDVRDDVSLVRVHEPQWLSRTGKCMSGIVVQEPPSSPQSPQIKDFKLRRSKRPNFWAHES